ncbi:RrF2 family transcriptional regulator [Zafaria sp. Z1313]|uniref:RrF2 family transcriptional regulator n=1 Tax=unclassified Zafaria TaxID=2828765 RepID=UPI002E7A8FFD|nr:Rrf2 family transcriptional regulator [Zafaria sp. J156]MEE1622056.1 Rrf2 family transcriptional regulator [Zafaria sp. J156]
MKLNAFGDVCLRILMLLGSREGEQLTSRAVAEAIGIPYNHVSKAVLELGRRGALEVARGRTGGARITPAGLGLSVGSLLRSLDEQPDVVDCTSGDHACPLIAGCRLRGALNRAREAFYAELDPLTIADLTRDPRLVRLPLPTFP